MAKLFGLEDLGAQADGWRRRGDAMAPRLAQAWLHAEHVAHLLVDLVGRGTRGAGTGRSRRAPAEGSCVLGGPGREVPGLTPEHLGHGGQHR